MTCCSRPTSSWLLCLMARRFWSRLPALNPDLIILDISLGDMAGFEVARRLKKAGVPAKVIFLTVHENIDFVRAAFDVGAVGYVYKSRISSDLIDAIDTICAGGHFSSADVVASGNLSP